MTAGLVMIIFNKQFRIEHTNSGGHTTIIEGPNLFCKKVLPKKASLMSVEYSNKSKFSAETFSNSQADYLLWEICLIHLESPSNINICVNKHFVTVRKIP